MSDAQPTGAGRSGLFTDSSVPDSYASRLVPVLFGPWAERLVEFASVSDGEKVLDVACGTGVVARAAARRAGPSGQVVASDLSPAMLVEAASAPQEADAAAIEFLEAPADALPLPDGRFDVVVCQQGFQFFPARAAAAAELHRVLAAGGRIALSVWATGHPLEPFGPYGEALAAVGAEEPFPQAFQAGTFALGAEALRELLNGAGFRDVVVELVQYTAVWPDARAVADGIMGTPFGPLVAGLDPERRERLRRDLADRFAPASPGGPVERVTTALLARGARG